MNTMCLIFYNKIIKFTFITRLIRNSTNMIILLIHDNGMIMYGFLNFGPKSSLIFNKYKISMWGLSGLKICWYNILYMNQEIKQSKICWDCKEELPLSAFSKATSRCKKCKLNYNKQKVTCPCGMVVTRKVMVSSPHKNSVKHKAFFETHQ